ncbi:hypothetical protein LO80_03115 [Candidatus Francisella endociliophora]|uniref:Uncharacterized protein n=1 Tax=Candidatus Francisella endociliophora TaxID=653937 RepID=A0A097ENC2_9GAMM|nr:hypothetical protein [Francisella sp. FSC1006]AIT09063.1 hypothetical protein LO80_03115 [Francisella sp. FSC1006]
MGVIPENIGTGGGGSSETASSIKTKYESNQDTNAYTDDEKSKVANTPANVITELSNKEPVFNKNTAFNKNFGSGADEVLEGNATFDASRITSGIIDIARLPNSAFSKLVTVTDETARFALTTATVQEGDSVKQNDTGVLYFVSDELNLNNSSGYTEYTASIDWSSITSKPQNIIDIESINASNDDIIQKKAGVFVNRTLEQLKTDLNITAQTSNLSVSRTINSVTVVNSAGDDAVIPEANFNFAGAMNTTDKVLLDLYKNHIGKVSVFTIDGGTIDNVSDLVEVNGTSYNGSSFVSRGINYILLNQGFAYELVFNGFPRFTSTSGELALQFDIVSGSSNNYASTWALYKPINANSTEFSNCTPKMYIDCTVDCQIGLRCVGLNNFQDFFTYNNTSHITVRVLRKL